MNPNPVLDTSERRITLAGLLPGLPRVLLAAAVVALVLGAALGASRGDEFRYFFRSYLTSYCFFLSISLGALFFVAALHATRAGWGVSVRRLAEIFAAGIGVLAILFLPILLPLLVPALGGRSSLYAWAGPGGIGEGGALTDFRFKAAYLSVPFFAVRAAGYFAVWWLLARFFLKHSTDQDATGDPALTIRMERWSGPALVALGVTGTLAAFDWLMSLEPAWYSTIYGLYFYSGAVVAALAALILAAMGLQAAGRLTTAITAEHYHDLGKLLLSAVVFWGYMAFSQFLLFWYGNIPEETEWYRGRMTGFWGWIGLAVLFGNLLIPFFGLVSREAKRRKLFLAFWAAWLLVFHGIDLWWLVMPGFSGGDHPGGSLVAGLIDVCLWVGIGGAYLAGVSYAAAGRALVALRDPRLEESLTFENT